MNGWTLTLQSSVLIAVISVIALLATLTVAWIACRRGEFRRQVVMLELLRITIVSIAVFLFNQPETIQRIFPTTRPTMVVLVDQSQSMTTRDVAQSQGDDPAKVQSRSQATRSLLQPDAWSSIQQEIDVVIAPFSEQPQSDQSDLHGALERTLTGHANLRAVVLASDGDWNSGPPPVEIASRFRTNHVPVFTVPVGSTSRLPDIELIDFRVPASGVIGNTIRIPITVESSLPRDHLVVARVEIADGKVMEHELRIAAMGRTEDAFFWKPEQTGDFTLTLSIPPHGDEAITDNNSLSMPITIREEKLRVLIVESLPRWEFRYLRNALARDSAIEVSCLLMHPSLSKVGGGNSDYLQSFPEALDQLSQYDVVFLGDIGIGQGQLSEEQGELLKGLVEQQASGLVFIPGIQGNTFSIVDTPLGELLPVSLDLSQPKGSGSSVPSQYALTESGRKSLLTRLVDSEDENVQVWSDLPGFQWHAPVLRAKAGADVLAVHFDSSTAYGRIPLITTRNFGAGKVMLMGTDGAWRWRRGVEDLYHYRFWGQVVRWMAYQRNMAKGETMRFYYSPERPRSGQVLSLHTIAMNASGEPLSRESVTARITTPAGKVASIPMQNTNQQWGAFAAEYVANEVGIHRVEILCQQTDDVLQTSIYISEAMLEKVGKPARPEVLEELARISRGQVFNPNEMETITKAISEIPESPPQVRRLRLWSHPFVAVLMIGLLGVFWTGRKLVGLV